MTAIDEADTGGGDTDAGDVKHVVTVARGAGFIGAGRIFSFLIRFVMAVLVARWLGADDYGLYIIAVTVAEATASLASLGLDAAMERQVAIQMRRKDRTGARGTLQVGLVGTVVTTVVFAICLWLFDDAIAGTVFDEPDLGPLVGLAAVATPLVGLSTLLAASIRGFKRMDLSALTEDVIQPVTRFVVLLLMALAAFSAFRAGVAYAISYGVVILVLVLLLHRQLPLVGPDLGARRDVKEVTAFAFPFWFSGFTRLLRTRLQPILLGVFGSAANVGVFSVVTSANRLGRIANLAIGTASRPTLAELHDANDHRELGRLYATTTRWTLALNLPVFLVMILVPESLLAVFGESFTDGVTPLVVVAWAEVVNAATGMCGPILAMSGHNRLKMVNSFVWMAVSITANVIMIPAWGVVGAGVAILVSTSTVNLLRIVELWFLLRMLPWDRRIWKPVLAAATTLLAGFGALLVLPDRLGIAELAVFMVAVATVFFAVLVALGLEADDQLLVGRLSGRLARTLRRDRVPSSASPVSDDGGEAP